MYQYFPLPDDCTSLTSHRVRGRRRGRGKAHQGNRGVAARLGGRGPKFLHFFLPKTKAFRQPSRGRERGGRGEGGVEGGSEGGRGATFSRGREGGTAGEGDGREAGRKGGNRAVQTEGVTLLKGEVEITKGGRGVIHSLFFWKTMYYRSNSEHKYCNSSPNLAHLGQIMYR